MKSIYKFCDLIEEVSERNTNLEYGLNDIVGVTINKGIISTVANLTQTALNKFYVIRRKTFIYNPRTHGVRLGMGYNDTDNVYITTWNNIAFKVKDSVKDILNPDYLWLYFNRSEWDRETNYNAWGSSTIVFSWSIFLNLTIELPDKEFQDTIVNQYKAITDRIALKQKINDNLDAQAEAIYKDIFVINPSPDWATGTLKDLLTVKYGKDHKQLADGNIPLYGSGGIMRYVERALYEKESVLVPRKGSLNNVLYVNKPFWSVDTMFYTEMKHDNVAKYVYYYIREKDLAGMDTGSAVPSMSAEIIHSMQLFIPDNNTLDRFERILKPIFLYVETNTCEIEYLKALSQNMLTILSSR